jgi:serine/threonine-protein kinase
VKPANILLGRDHSIKVTDFGIADLVSSLGGDSDSVFGTPGYLPPETLQGEGYGPSSDLFSLGVILYYAVTGVQPFEGKTVKEIIRKTLFGVVPPASEVQPSISNELDALIMALLERSPDHRPSQASDLAERLENWAHSEGFSWRLEAANGGEGGDEGEEAPSLWIPTSRIDS